MGETCNLKEEHRWSLQRANSWCSAELVMDSYSKAAENILSTVTLHISFWVHLPVTNPVMCPTVHKPHKTMRSRSGETLLLAILQKSFDTLSWLASFCQNVTDPNLRLQKEETFKNTKCSIAPNVHLNLVVDQCVTVTLPAWKDNTEVRAGCQYQYRFQIHIPIHLV